MLQRRWRKKGQFDASGFTTNSITQTFNRRVLDHYLANSKKPLSLKFAIPDHPWSDSEGSAAVRISMSVGEYGRSAGSLQYIDQETPVDDGPPTLMMKTETGRIESRFRIGTTATEILELAANDRISGFGSAMHGAGFILEPNQAEQFRQRGASVIRPYLGGRDLLQQPRARFVIDFSGLSKEEARDKNPLAFQHVIDHVLPEREQNRRKSIRELWWRFGWERPLLRHALAGLTRYIATTETAAHRVFQFINGAMVPDHMVIVIAINDAFILGILSSRFHVVWTLRMGGTLEDRPRYNTKVCFDPFPFPAATEKQKERIRALGERLDAFRKERLAAHSALTMTKLYNVLAKLRAEEPLNEKDRAIHEMGLVSVLKQIHDDLDEAVADAYGWPVDLSEEAILEKLVALNKERAAEERRGIVRWLRPEFQAPKEARAAPKQVEAELVEAEAATVKPQFPKVPAEQVTAVRAMLAAEGRPIRAGELARKFKQGKKVEGRVSDLLQIMAAIGQAQTENGSRYFAPR